MTKADFAAVLQRFQSAQSFVIASHHCPDGDAIGSILGVYHLLTAMGKKDIVCLCEDSVPKIYQWLSGADRITSQIPPGFEPDLAVIVDLSCRNRLGSIAQAISESTPVIIIDHHLDEAPKGDLILSDHTYCATGEVVAELYQEAGIAMTPEVAACLYVAIITDTGCFRFSNTTPRCLRAAATVIEAGIDPSEIAPRSSTLSPFPSLRFWGA